MCKESYQHVMTPVDLEDNRFVQLQMNVKSACCTQCKLVRQIRFTETKPKVETARTSNCACVALSTVLWFCVFMNTYGCVKKKKNIYIWLTPVKSIPLTVTPFKVSYLTNFYQFSHFSHTDLSN